MYKTCTKCKEIKDISQFGKNKRKKDGLQHYCIPCHIEFNSKWYIKNKERLIRKASIRNTEITKISQDYVYNYLLSNPCVICGEKDPIVLEFDHLRDKIESISAMISRKYSLDLIKEEIKKCQVLCANCHRRKTSKQFNFYKEKGE